MKKRIIFAALGLAAAFLMFGQSSAKADHCRSGYGGGYGGYRGGGYGGIGVTPVYRAPVYGYGGYGSSYRGYDRGHHHGYYSGYRNYGRGYGYGNSIRVRTPSFSFGLYR